MDSQRECSLTQMPEENNSSVPYSPQESRRQRAEQRERAGVGSNEDRTREGSRPDVPSVEGGWTWPTSAGDTGGEFAGSMPAPSEPT